MAKLSIQFLCNSCGSVHPKWLGKCPDCGTWDALEEYKAPTPDAHRPGNDSVTGDLARAGEAITILDIDQAESPRLPTGISEFDRILGGGVVPGSAVLVGGEPGIGKSTLLLQVAQSLSSIGVPPMVGEKKHRRDADATKVLYVTSEESARQVALRAGRLGVASDNLLVLAETNVERIINQIAKLKPAVVIIDLIQ